MISRQLRWSWQDRDIVLGLDEAGSADPIKATTPEAIMALSSVSVIGNALRLRRAQL
jgi:cation transport ATPase